VDGGDFGLAGSLVTSFVVWIAGVYSERRRSRDVDRH
jgi:hypothetical protein